MKKRIAAVALIMILLCFTGCMHCENTMVLNEDGSGHVVSSVWIDKETADAVGVQMEMSAEEMGISEARIEEKDGRAYYVAEDRVEFADCEELKAFLENSGYRNIYVSSDLIHFTFYSDLTEADVESMKEWMDESGIMASIAVSMPEEIVFTNGQLSDDKKSAVFSFDSDELVTSQEIIVSTVPAEEETEGPVISGAKNKKVYNSARTIAVKDASGVQKAQYKFREASAENTVSTRNSAEKKFSAKTAHIIFVHMTTTEIRKY